MLFSNGQEVIPIYVFKFLQGADNSNIVQVHLKLLRKQGEIKSINLNICYFTLIGISNSRGNKNT